MTLSDHSCVVVAGLTRYRTPIRDDRVVIKCSLLHALCGLSLLLHYVVITTVMKEQKKNVTVKCNTAARQTRQIKTFQLDLIYLNPALHFFMSGEHQSSETLNWMYLVTGYFPTASQQNIVCCDKCHRQFYSSSCNYSTIKDLHTVCTGGTL